MARTDERGGPRTRARIAETASRLFLERGFDAVSVAEIAREAGVSSVTVFNHFPRKEDLFLDRQADAAEILRRAVRDRPAGADVLTSLHEVTLRLAEDRSPLSGLDDRSGPFFRTVADSPALIARARAIAAELQAVLSEALERDGDDSDRGVLLAAFFLAGYSTVFLATARRLLAGTPSAEIVGDHLSRLERLFDALRSGADSPGRRAR
jgi:AcrR family transcriptional regulator